MLAKEFVIKDTIKLFPGPSGWVYVDVPREYVPKHSKKTHFGLIPIQARVGKTLWNTSLLPRGKGGCFVALKAEIRKKEKLMVGDTVTVSFALE